MWEFISGSAFWTTWNKTTGSVSVVGQTCRYTHCVIYFEIGGTLYHFYGDTSLVFRGILSIGGNKLLWGKIIVTFPTGKLYFLLNMQEFFGINWLSLKVSVFKLSSE